MSKPDILLDVDPDFYKGSGEFDFPNGDRYVGEYCAHRTGIVWREGHGKYTTADGHCYVGEWRDDKLVETNIIEVAYKEGDQFHGYIVKNKYEGSGMYIFDHKMALLCEFNNNKPTGELIIIDTKGREWHGVAAQDDALLLPEHIYFNNISDNAGKGKRRQRHRTQQSDLSFRSKSISGTGKQKMKSISQLFPNSGSLSQGSKIIEAPKPPTQTQQSLDNMKAFAKTKKTASDLQFETSDWYKNYINFRTVYDNIRDKIDKEGEQSLNEEEKNWHGKFMKFKQRYWQIINSWKNKDKKISKEYFFELMRCREFEEKCPPVHVIYATADCGSVCDCEIVAEEENIDSPKL